MRSLPPSMPAHVAGQQVSELGRAEHTRNQSKRPLKNKCVDPGFWRTASKVDDAVGGHGREDYSRQEGKLQIV